METAASVSYLCVTIVRHEDDADGQDRGTAGQSGRRGGQAARQERVGVGARGPRRGADRAPDRDARRPRQGPAASLAARVALAWRASRAELAWMKRWLIDTGPLVAYIDADDRAHGAVAARLDGFTGRLHTTAAVITEAMHMVGEAADGPETLA